MGQEHSAPRTGTKLQVIGAGLPRTGTASFSKALDILLDGPIYHGGTSLIKGPEIESESWTRIVHLLFPHSLNKTRPLLGVMPHTKTSTLTNTTSKRITYSSKADIPSADRAEAMKLLRQRLDGYSAVTDSPASSLVPEIIELYPDALVICTIRDVPGWSRSMATVSSTAAAYILRFILFPLPTLRLFPKHIDALTDQWAILYGETTAPTEITWDKHIDRLREVVPRERLVFYNVQEGWGPLCKALGVEVPRDEAGREIEFPRINDGEAIQKLAASCMRKGLLAWAGILGSVTVVVAGVIWMRK